MTENAFILNFFRFYNILWSIALPFLGKNKRLQKGFKKRTSNRHHKRADLWIQAASAGEAYLAVFLLKNFRPRARCCILVTSITSQGINILKQHLSGATLDQHIHLSLEWFPFDQPAIVKEAVEKIAPKVMVLLETEMWPALLFYLKQKKTHTMIINARLSKKSYFVYLKTRFFWKHLHPDTIMAVSELDARRYQSIFDKSDIKTMHNMKFESLDMESSSDSCDVAVNPASHKDIPFTLFASVRKPEAKQITKIIRQIICQHPKQIIAIFPRHLNHLRFWKNTLSNKDIEFKLRSRLTDNLSKPGIILWDKFGELKQVYKQAEIVFVGGSLKPLGGQNFIESAITGAVTIIGPFYDDFFWVGEELFIQGIVLKKRTTAEIISAILYFLNQPSNRSDRKKMADKYIAAHCGGTRQAANEILKILNPVF